MKCIHCDGSGQIANDDNHTPWKYWEELPKESAIAVQLGWVRPIECPACKGKGYIENKEKEK